MLLATLIVDPTPNMEMVVFQGQDRAVPLFRTATANGDEFLLDSVIATEADPKGIAVATYTNGAGEIVVLKTLPYDDNTSESEKVEQINALGSNVLGTMVQARVVHQAKKKSFGEKLEPRHFTAVAMDHGGVTLDDYNFGNDYTPGHALLLLLVLAKMCKRLYAHGLAYLDLKVQNVLVDVVKGSTSVLFCDFGSLAKVGESASATYPPPSFPLGTHVLANEASVLHGLGALLVHMVDGSSTYHKNLKYLTKKRTAEQARLGDSAFFKARIDFVKDDFVQSQPALGSVLTAAWADGMTLGTFVDVVEKTYASMTQGLAP